MKQWHLAILASLLAAAGFALFLYKWLALGFPLTPGTQTHLWNIESRIVFDADGGPVKATLTIPRNTRNFQVIDEHFVSQGFGLATAVRDDGNREAVWSMRDAKGRHTLYYRAVIVRADINQPVNDADRAVKPPEIPEIRLADQELAAARAVVGEVRARSADTDTLVAQLINQLHAVPPDSNTALLLGRNVTSRSRMDLAVQILALAGIPARVAHGIALEEERRAAPLHHWLQVFEKGRWVSYDAESGQRITREKYLTWWRGEGELVKLEGAKRVHIGLSVNRTEEPGLRVATEGAYSLSPRLLQFSLFTLPIETQTIYRVLLVIPLGAVILVLLRNIVGVKTFGTFMPVLIALAFRETQLLWGIVLFSIVVGLGLAVRFYLDRLRLLLVPRLAAVLIVVILLMAGISVVSHALGIERGLSLALFPMVIMTMTIERMSIVWDERGPYEALLQGAGSFVAASVAFVVMFNRLVGHLAFVFPELLLVLLAVTLLLGRYAGYRLSELVRFKVLAKKPG
jgi:hypothetical protein